MTPPAGGLARRRWLPNAKRWLRLHITTIAIGVIGILVGGAIATVAGWITTPADPGPAPTINGSNVPHASRREEIDRQLTLLCSDSQEIYWNASAVLNGMGRDAVPALIAMLSNIEMRCRGHAAMALGEMKNKAIDAIPQLLATLRDDVQAVRVNAQLALGKIPLAIPHLIKSLNQSDDDRVTINIIRALRDHGPAAKEALPLLRTLSREPRYQEVAEAALVEIDR